MPRMDMDMDIRRPIMADMHLHIRKWSTMADMRPLNRHITLDMDIMFRWRMHKLPTAVTPLELHTIRN